MIVKNITDVSKFFEIIRQCEGSVNLITEYGDILNLKSLLCQYISLTQVFNNPKIGEIKIECSNQDDNVKLLKFMIEG